MRTLQRFNNFSIDFEWVIRYIIWPFTPFLVSIIVHLYLYGVFTVNDISSSKLSLSMGIFCYQMILRATSEDKESRKYLYFSIFFIFIVIFALSTSNEVELKGSLLSSHNLVLENTLASTEDILTILKDAKCDIFIARTNKFRNYILIASVAVLGGSIYDQRRIQRDPEEELIEP